MCVCVCVCVCVCACVCVCVCVCVVLSVQYRNINVCIYVCSLGHIVNLTPPTTACSWYPNMILCVSFSVCYSMGLQIKEIDSSVKSKVCV